MHTVMVDLETLTGRLPVIAMMDRPPPSPAAALLEIVLLSSRALTVALFIEIPAPSARHSTAARLGNPDWTAALAQDCMDWSQAT